MEDSRESGKKEHSSKSNIGQGFGNLGAHGIPNIKRAKNTYRRFFWLIAFLCGLSAFTYHCYNSVSQYLLYEVTVNLDIRYEPQMVFPAVTICNLNPVKESALMHFAGLNTLLGPPPGDNSSGMPMMPSPSMTTEGATTVSPDRNHSLSTPVDFMETVVNESNVASPWPGGNMTNGSPPGPAEGLGVNVSVAARGQYQDWDRLNYEAMDSHHSLIDLTTDIIGSMNYEDRKRTGHNLDTMLLSCTFRGFPCGPANFTWFYNYQYGNCYTFNSGESSDIQMVSTAGPLFGLTVSLYIEQDEYITDIQQGAGIRVKVHPQNEMPFPEDEGLNVSPGTEAFISFRKKVIQRKDTPFTNCTVYSINDTIFSEYFPQVEYSKLMCEKDCYFRIAFERCGCADVKYRYDDSIPACNASNHNNVRCLKEVDFYYTTGRIPCSCTLACEEEDFKPVVSYSAWPNEKYKPVVEAGIKEISADMRKKVDDDPTFVDKNVAKLNVYFEELTYDYIYQTETYSETDLLSDIGGNVGLWVGISALTVVEIAELIYDIFVLLCFGKARKAGEKRDNTTSDNHLEETTDQALSKKRPYEASYESAPEPAYIISHHQGFNLRPTTTIYPELMTSQRSRKSRRTPSNTMYNNGMAALPPMVFPPETMDSKRVVYNPGYKDGNFNLS